MFFTGSYDIEQGCVGEPDHRPTREGAQSMQK